MTMNKSRREEMKKQFFRVKQLADQTFARAEKSEILSEDLINVEKKVELIKSTCDKVSKKLQACLQGQGSDGVALDKRLKKMAEMQLSNCMTEASIGFGDQSILGPVLQMCGNVEKQLSNELLDYEVEMERLVINKQLEILETDVPSIIKQKKHLAKLILDMDSARTRYQTAARHSTAGAAIKADGIKEEMDDASLKVEQCRDALAAEMFSLISRECEMAQHLSHLVKCQADYHKKSLRILENCCQQIDDEIGNYHAQPMYGMPLDEHLRITDRSIALPIEACCCFLLECGLNEEGLFRVAGGASKVKKLTAAFDANLIGIIDMNDYTKDPHAVAGALKSYLRHLPDPLLTHQLYSEWMAASRISNVDDRLQALWVVLRKLPEPYFNNLRYLIKFLSRLAANQDVNKMSSQNLALIMGPNLLWAPDDASIMNMTMANAFSTIADHFISQADWFFPGEVEFFVSYAAPTPRSPYEGGFVSSPEIDLTGPNGDAEFSGNGPENSASNHSSPQSGASPKSLRRSKKPAPPIPAAMTRERPHPAERTSLTDKFPEPQKSTLERKKSIPTEMTPQMSVLPVNMSASMPAGSLSLSRNQLADKPQIPEKPTLEKRASASSTELNKSPVPQITPEPIENQRIPPSPEKLSDDESPVPIRRRRQSPSPGDRFDYYRPEWYGSIDSEPSDSPPTAPRKQRLNGRNLNVPPSDTESDVTQSSAEDLNANQFPMPEPPKIIPDEDDMAPIMSASRAVEMSRAKETIIPLTQPIAQPRTEIPQSRSETPERPVKPPRLSDPEINNEALSRRGSKAGDTVKPRRPKPPEFAERPARPPSVIPDKPERPDKPPQILMRESEMATGDKPPQLPPREFGRQSPYRGLSPSPSPTNFVPPSEKGEKIQSIKYTLVVGAKKENGSQEMVSLQDAQMPRTSIPSSPVAPRRPPRPHPPPPLKTRHSSSEDTHL